MAGTNTRRRPAVTSETTVPSRGGGLTALPARPGTPTGSPCETKPIAPGQGGKTIAEAGGLNDATRHRQQLCETKPDPRPDWKRVRSAPAPAQRCLEGDRAKRSQIPAGTGGGDFPGWETGGHREAYRAKQTQSGESGMDAKILCDKDLCGFLPTAVRCKTKPISGARVPGGALSGFLNSFTAGGFCVNMGVDGTSY